MWVVRLRQTSQVFFVLLFFYLLIVTAYYPINQTGGPVSFFFEIDPLVLLSTWLAGVAIPAALFLSLIVVLATLIFGRWFCGWVCPLGAINQFFSSLTLRKPKDRIALGAFSPHLRWKYYLLFALLGGALIGMNLIGWFDPFSILMKGVIGYMRLIPGLARSERLW